LYADVKKNRLVSCECPEFRQAAHEKKKKSVDEIGGGIAEAEPHGPPFASFASLVRLAKQSPALGLQLVNKNPQRQTNFR